MRVLGGLADWGRATWTLVARLWITQVYVQNIVGIHVLGSRSSYV